MDFAKILGAVARFRGRGGLVRLGVAFAALAVIAGVGLKNAILTAMVLALAFIVLGLVVWAAKFDDLAEDATVRRSQLERVIARSLEPPGLRTLPGPNGIEVREYVNLRAACGVRADLKVVVEALCTRIRELLDLDNWDAVVVPVQGNILLGTAVADELGLQPILVRESPIEGRWVESPISQGRAFLVDDVCGEGVFLIETAERAKKAGFPPSRAFVVIERSEGGARDELHRHPVELTAIMRMGDAELAALRDRVRLEA